MIDNGAHVEYATPEVSSPRDAVIAVRAGELILRSLVSQLPGVVLSRSNFCYIGRRTYASHENHSIRSPIHWMNNAILSHLVSRTVYCGAGGLHPRTGTSFVLSPRALSMTHRLVCSRIEAHAHDDSGRLHVPFGDTLAMNQSCYLKIGTTALLIALLDRRSIDADDLPELVDPVAAAAAIAADPSLTVTVEVSGGRRRTALQIQHRILELVDAAVRARSAAIPDWAEHVVEEWRTVLWQLAEAPDDSCLDWVVKRKVFALETRRLADAPTRQGHETSEDALRWRLAKVDFMFAALPHGVAEEFTDDAGPAISADEVEQARTSPPGVTRAQTRSRFIAAHHAARDRYRVDWSGILDCREDRVLRMDSPTRPAARWIDSPTCVAQRNPWSAPLLDRLSRLYNVGDYRRLRRVLAEHRVTTETDRGLLLTMLPYHIWAESRTGHAAAARHTFLAYQRLNPRHGPALGVMRVGIERFCGLQPPAEIFSHIATAQEAETTWVPGAVCAFRGHHGYALRCVGRVDEAIEVFRRSVDYDFPWDNVQRLVARNQCDLADCLRVRGQLDEARALLDAAGRVYDRSGFAGEDADHRQPVLAKMADDRSEALRILTRARDTAARHGNVIGVVRISLLAARFDSDLAAGARTAAICRRLQSRRPDLSECPRLARILDHWQRWISWAGGPEDTHWFL